MSPERQLRLMREYENREVLRAMLRAGEALCLLSIVELVGWRCRSRERDVSETLARLVKLGRVRQSFTHLGHELFEAVRF